MSRNCMQPLSGSLEYHECFGASQALGKDALDAPQMPGQPGTAPGVGAGPRWGGIHLSQLHSVDSKGNYSVTEALCHPRAL